IVRQVITVPAGMVIRRGSGAGGSDATARSAGLVSSGAAARTEGAAEGAVEVEAALLLDDARRAARLGAGLGGGSRASGAEDGAAADSETASWLITCFTPFTWLANCSTAVFTSSVLTAPVRPTTPFCDTTRISRVLGAGS